MAPAMLLLYHSVFILLVECLRRSIVASINTDCRINQYRLPSYHRLDLSAVLQGKNNYKRKLKTEWVFSIYNAYSRANPYFIYFDQEGSPYNGTLKVQAKQVSIFPIIPAVTWNFKF